jgi:hypothetical protein
MVGTPQMRYDEEFLDIELKDIMVPFVKYIPQIENKFINLELDKARDNLTN